jgi:hypothetical protein
MSGSTSRFHQARISSFWEHDHAACGRVVDVKHAQQGYTVHIRGG